MHICLNVLFHKATLPRIFLRMYFLVYMSLGKQILFVLFFS